MNKLLFPLLLCTLIGFSSVLLAVPALAQGQNQAVDLDGATQYVDMGDVLNDFDLPFTFSAWIYWNGSNGSGFFDSQGIVSSDNSPNNYAGFRLLIRPDGSLRASVMDGGPTNSNHRRGANSPPGVVPVGQWTQIAVVVRGLTDVSHYVNGVDVGVAGYTGSGGDMVHTDRPFVIGRYTYNLSAGDDFFFDGAIDEVRLWDRALSQNEIQALKDIVLDASYYNDPANELIGYWRFDELEDLGAGGDGADDFRDFSLRANPGDAVNGPILVAGAPIGEAQDFDLTMTPTGPLTVPPGGQVSFDYTIANNTDNTVTGDFYFVARRNGNVAAQSVVLSGSLPGGQTVESATTINVPGAAPQGDYELTFSIGNAFGQSVDDVTYTVTVEGAAREGGVTWDVAEASPWMPVGTKATALPETVALEAPYPNPTSGQATVGFALPEAGAVRLAVYDVLGREVAVLLDGTRKAGVHAATFDAHSLAGGLYLVRLDAMGTVQTQRLTLVR